MKTANCQLSTANQEVLSLPMPIHLYKNKWANRATVIYWLLLIYVLAALIWWFIALNLQNRQMAEYKMSLLIRDDSAYKQKLDNIYNERTRKTGQYVSEGLVFLSVILIGAIFLYSAVMRQIRIQRQQQNFMMAITHELKTPISIARLNMETLQKHHLDDSMKEKILKSSLQELNRLNTLTGNILVSAQLEGGSYLFNKEELNFSQIVTESCHDFANRFPNRSWKIELEPGLFISGDPLLMQILVNNLIDNAVKYSPPASLITIILKKDMNQGILELRDEGPGIPKNEYKRIFQKFYRLGNEDTRTAQGTGLGLYLCRKITQDHKMRILVSGNQPKGSIFMVQFNLIQV
jgi:two-component system, OmpR family, sensor histidine kinase CiaH